MLRDSVENDALSQRFRSLSKEANGAIAFDDDLTQRFWSLSEEANGAVTFADELVDIEVVETNFEDEAVDVVIAVDVVESTKAVDTNPSFNTLWELSKHLTMKQAAAKLNVGTTTFKAMCRKHGIEYWPYRRFQSYYALQNSVVTTDSDKVRVCDRLKKSRICI